MIKPMIIDCDPGLDDLLTLIMANKIDSIDVLGITTVAGNASIENTSDNAIRILNILEWNIPVIKGSKNPLKRDRSISKDRTGIGNLVLDKSDKNYLNKSVEDFIYEEAKKYRGELEILALGPMTNISKTIIKYPDITDMIKSITFMGGTIDKGNITEYAEFNMYVDPDAADIVFKSGISITMVGLNVTEKVYFTLEDICRIEKHSISNGNLIKEILLNLLYQKCNHKQRKVRVHDLVALGSVINPEIFKRQRFFVEIEKNNKDKLGMLYVYDMTQKGIKNISVTLDVDVKLFKGWIEKLNY